MARYPVTRRNERTHRMEWRSQTGEFGNRRQTSLRLSGQFQDKRSKSLWRLHWNAKPRRLDPQWRGDKRSRFRLLTINLKQNENKSAIEIIRTNSGYRNHPSRITRR